MSHNSALASLTATYTDSENEEDRNDEDTDGSTESQVIIPVRPETPKPAEEPSKKIKNPKKSLRLVSYNDNNDDDEGRREGGSEEEDQGDEAMDTSNDDGTEPANGDGNMEIADAQADNKIDDKSSEDDPVTKYGFALPAEPKGKCAPELQEKISGLYEKMITTNMDMNKVIQERKEFRNPSIYEKLIQFCDINEFGTNYPPEIYDPLQWGPESFYEELAKTQKIEMDRREQDKKDKSKVNLALAAAKKVEEEAKKRKSKWDQPGPSAGNTAAVQANLKPAGLVQPSLTTNITGTKGTIISAFGSLPKKPKV